jgi:imidazolonepropionase-like amidohydrolase
MNTGTRVAFRAKISFLSSLDMKDDEMKHAAAALAFLALAACMAPQPTPVGAGLVISNVTVISSERAAPLANAFVRVVDDRIVEVSSAPLEGERSLDGGGGFLIPGLIDGHVHLDVLPVLRPEDEAKHPGLGEALRVQEPRSYLYFGFTTVVDLSRDPGFIAGWNARAVRPDAFFCGSAAMYNGYPMVLLPPQVAAAAFPYFLYDPAQAASTPVSVDPAKHQPATIVERMAKDGAICVKTYNEPGFGGARNLPNASLAQVREIITAAHARDMPVFMHANSIRAQQFAVEAGVDVVAHAAWNDSGLSGEAKAQALNGIVAGVKAKGMAYQPTFRVLNGIGDMFDPALLADPRMAHATPPAALRWFATPDAEWMRKEMAGDWDASKGAPPFVASSLAQGGNIVAKLNAAGARLVFGSDTPSASTYGNPPGLNGRLEMDYWVDAGVSEEALFRAMTRGNAELFNLDDRGTIEPGKKAYMLLLRENPLESVAAYDSIVTVFSNGVAIPRSELSATAP